MQPELDTTDPEVLAFASVIQNAPTLATLDVSQEVLPGNFSDRDPVLAQNDSTLENVHNITPPTIA